MFLIVSIDVTSDKVLCVVSILHRHSEFYELQVAGTWLE
jgi:hypothetical protein